MSSPTYQNPPPSYPSLTYGPSSGVHNNSNPRDDPGPQLEAGFANRSYGSTNDRDDASAHERTPLMSKSKHYANRLTPYLLTLLTAVIIVLLITVPGPAHYISDGIITAQHDRAIARMKTELELKDTWVVHEREKLEAWVEHEKEQLDARAAQEREKLARERDQLAEREVVLRRDEERRAGEEALRQRTHLRWGALQWHEACLGWKRMRYSAELLELPQGVDGLEWCRQTKMELFGKVYDKPEYCEMNSAGRVIGNWIRTDEPYCNTYWGRLQDSGCQVGVPGYRRIRMQLLDHRKPWDETWFALCQTTPWPGHGTPENCEEYDGIWGEWRVLDDQCRNTRV